MAPAREAWQRGIAYNYALRGTPARYDRPRSADRRPLDGAPLSDGFAFTRESQPRTARRSDAAARVGADPCRRRQRQDARADDAHRVAARHRTGEPALD